ncbi:MAG: undecaprenyl-diphosphatase UppP, partial [bacterium]
MDLLSALLLGLVQGLTEFLPISSSGHLVLAQQLLGFKEPMLFFDLLLHLGTLAAVVIYFRKDLLGILRQNESEESLRLSGRRWLILIAVGTIPTGLIGFFFKDQFEALFGSPKIVSIMLLITALLLAFSDRVKSAKSRAGHLVIWQSLIVGVAQGIAIIPGLSRSGATITAAIFSGVQPNTAARFSFLLSIPAILGATALEAGDAVGSFDGNWVVYLLGVSVAFVSGYFSIDILLKLVTRRKLWRFSVYLI